MFFFNDGNPFLVEISSRKNWGSRFEAHYKEVLKHFFYTPSVRTILKNTWMDENTGVLSLEMVRTGNGTLNLLMDFIIGFI